MTDPYVPSQGREIDPASSEAGNPDVQAVATSGHPGTDDTGAQAAPQGAPPAFPDQPADARGEAPLDAVE